MQKFLRAATFLLARAVIAVPSKMALARRDYVKLFDRRPKEAHKPNWIDLWSLYKMIRRRKPKNVLEFGSGCSTIIISQALADNAAEGAPGHLYSLDTKPEPGETDWGQVTLDSMPEYLKSFCTLNVVPVVLGDYEGIPAWRYQGVPEIAPDFVYLDGPGLVHTKHKRAADVLDIESHFRPGFRLLVDGRHENCQFLKDKLKKDYKIKYHPIFHRTTFDLA